MAEDFILEIYNRGRLISACKECEKLLYKRNYGDMGDVWKKHASMLIAICEEWTDKDGQKAETLERYAKAVPSMLSDASRAANVIRNGIIPLLYEYMNDYRGIEVSDGRWQLESSASGLITVKFSEKDFHLHSVDDPLWEAYCQSEELLTKPYENIVIMGCGLGYLPYALWEQSFKAADVYVLESDKLLLEYALKYGTLSYIDEEKLHIISNDNVSELAAIYDSLDLDKDSTLYHISEWYPRVVPNQFSEHIDGYIQNKYAELRMRRLHEINFMRNSKVFEGEIDEIVDRYSNDEFIIVAAGPSLSYNIDFIRESKDKRKIICVNTVLKKLLKEGIEPDLVTCADPSEGIYLHLDGIQKQTKELTLVAESVSYWKYVEQWRGRRYRFLGSGYEETVNEAKKNGKIHRPIGGTVSSMALEIAFLMHAKKIYLVGLDLAYPNNMKYADGVKSSIESIVEGNMAVPSVDGSMVKTVFIFDLFRKDIEEQIRKHPNVEVVNMSKQGAKIAGTFSF